MREDWPRWARRAWQRLTETERERGRAVWTRLAEAYDGVLVGPGPLVRDLVDAGDMGHRSTLDTIARLAGEDLVEVRQAAEGAVLWIPEELMPPPDAEARTRPRFAATARSNGERPSPRARV